MSVEKNEQMKIKPAGAPKPDKQKVQALKKQKAPQDKGAELPIDEGYSKTFLRVIVAVSVFLFAITLAGVLGINSMFENSKKQVVSNFTVQVLPLPNHEDSKNELTKVVNFFEHYPDVTEVVVLSQKELHTLIEPWLGNNIDIELLPIPKLIDVKINNAKTFDYKELMVRLSEVSTQASINDHNLWLSRLLRFINSLKMLAVTVLVLVAGACVAAIVYTAKTGLNVHRDIIQILHIMGATDEYIAINYVKQITAMSVVAGIIGTILSVPAIILIGDMAQGIEAGIFNSVTFGLNEWFAIMLLPIVSAILVAITAYVTVVRTLRSMV
jgi:cell division transport system permease protein